MSRHFDMFCGGAAFLAQNLEYSPLHERHGLSRPEWELLTSREIWSAAQVRRIRAIISEVLQVSMQIANLPATPVPGQYAAAVIATLVAPCNRVVACHRVPDVYDASKASGFDGPPEIVRMDVEQIIGIMLAFSDPRNGVFPDPGNDALDATIPADDVLPQAVKRRPSNAS